MLRFRAATFTRAMVELSKVTALLSMADSPAEIEVSRKGLTDELTALAQSLDSIQLGIVVRAQFERLAKHITTFDDSNREMIVTLVVELQNNMILEMTAPEFLYVPPQRSTYYRRAELFGEAVTTAFPSAAFDIEELGKCYALERNTAAVFHAMRVMEIGLGALARDVGVGISGDNWQNIIDQVVKAIAADTPGRNDGEARERKKHLSEVAIHLRLVKDAWRNHVMHVRDKYDGERALRIIEATRSFMQDLAEAGQQDVRPS